MPNLKSVFEESGPEETCRDSFTELARTPLSMQDSLTPPKPPRRTIVVSDETRFAKFLERLDDGLQGSGTEAHRVDIALRYFRRVADNYWTHHLGGDGSSQDQNEDIVVDAMTTLESILVSDERKGRGALMAARAAAILEEGDHERRDVRKRIERLYKLRSAILHGGARPAVAELTKAAIDAEEFSRRCLVAFLLTSGDRPAILKASIDATTATTLRRRIRQ